MGALETGLFLVDSSLFNAAGFFLVALGVLVSIRFTGFPDLTVDGSFTVGAALYAMSVKAGHPTPFNFLLALMGGALSGSLTCGINHWLRIGKIISSVIVMLTLILCTPYVFGVSTIGLLAETYWLAQVAQLDTTISRAILPEAYFSLHPLILLIFGSACLAAAAAVIAFFRSALGIQVRYLGSAQIPSLLAPEVRWKRQLVGLCIGNSLVALGGAVEAERAGGFNQSMGLGVLLVGLAILVLGESLVKGRVRRDFLGVGESAVAVGLGALAYSFGIQVLLSLNLTFVDVRLTATGLLVTMLAVAARRHPNSAHLF